MAPSPDEQRLQHIRDYCLKIQHALERFGMTWDSFKDDEDYQAMMVFFIMQIGELVRTLSDDHKRKTADVIPWPQIRSVRNRIVHNYGSVDQATIWDIIMHCIAPLKDHCDDALRS